MKNEESLKSYEEETIELSGLFPHSYQGDSRGAEIFSRLGVHTEYTERGVRLTLTGTPVTRLEEDMVDIPDLAQTFVVTCCLMNIPFRFTGLQSLKIKGDRPYHRPHHRTAQIRLCGAFRTGQHPAMEWRTLSGRERSPYRYLRRPPHGNGVCSCLHHIAAAND